MPSAGEADRSETFFHVALLVLDLDVAVERYERLFNVRFREPELFSVAHVEEPGFGRPAPHAMEVRISYSVEGPPYYELIEATGGTLFDPAQGEGFHHVGMWVNDASQHQRRQGADIETDVRLYASDGSLWGWFTRPASPPAVRVECVDAANRGRVELWGRRASPRTAHGVDAATPAS